MDILFLSDNTAPADPRVMQAVTDAGIGYAKSYGSDRWTEEAETLFRKEFGEQALYFPVLTGTGANVISLASVLSPYQSILCAETAHIACDECGAVERFTASKLVPVKTPDGKLKPEMLKPYLAHIGFEHQSQPKAVSISQTTETGTAYTPDELKELSDFTKQNNLILHIDGSRIANAAAGMSLSLKQACAGADILSFGGTKNGLMMGEAVIFLNPALAESAKYVRKQYGQLFSKMRYVSAQFIPYLKDCIWLENADRANAIARRLADGFTDRGISIKYPVNGNTVFAHLSDVQIKKLSEKYVFYVWDETENLCRFVCPYTATERDADGVLTLL
ncbi:low specificity L-threonine aldolase [Seleniivibrio sp.]|uniref:threonine aldolase family protein n=1 Tax=Seleniivibrio sp. TaxID=2898801 RepID=UPI0025E2E5FE|nr:low specificity L-threonine aldolase [Seleniivibrio sp.]MCD8553711.1 low specificity L-threonine aldolase [Seleniivibrio sp.]